MAENRWMIADSTVDTAGKEVKGKTKNWMEEGNMRCNDKEGVGRTAVSIKDEWQLGIGR
jgi:hypothetical protein